MRKVRNAVWGARVESRSRLACPNQPPPVKPGPQPPVTAGQLQLFKD